MSVILDALKKLDREKSSRRSGTADIAVEILRPDLPRPTRRTPLYLAIAFLTAIATAAITYGVIVKGGPVPKPSPPLAMAPPVPHPEAAPATPPSEPIRSARDETVPAPPKAQTPVKGKKLAVPSIESKGDETKIKQNVTIKGADIAPEKAKISPEFPPSQPPARELPPREPSATFPSLNISAIVWYEEPSKRFAMINGLIVTEGSVVEGMKVEEIYPDRVRFLHRNQRLEIPIK
jgi:general secretion pathway protein B